MVKGTADGTVIHEQTAVTQVIIEMTAFRFVVKVRIAFPLK